MQPKPKRKRRSPGTSRSYKRAHPPSPSTYNHLTPLNSDVPPPANVAAIIERRKREHSTPQRVPRDAPRCPACRGVGRVAIPDFSKVSGRYLASLAFVDQSYVSRLLNPHRQQTRSNPRLSTIMALQSAIETATGVFVPLDTIAVMVTAVRREEGNGGKVKVVHGEHNYRSSRKREGGSGT